MRERLSPLCPDEGETLASFLRRVQDERGIRNEALARRLYELDGSKKETSWLRQVKSWRSNGTAAPRSLDEQNATCLGKALTADFSAFLFDPTDRAWRDLLLDLRQGLVDLAGRVEELEARLPEG